MKRDFIDFRLFPDIIFNGNVYSNYNEYNHQMLANTNIPFLRAYNDAHDTPNLLLVGEGSIGKSTSLIVFKAEMLYQDKSCLLYECKSINSNDIAKIESIVHNHQTDIMIFDAYDELQESIRESFNDLIEKLNQHEIQIIVSSRFDPRTTDVTSEIFETYQPMYICDFSDEQLDSMVSNTISRNSEYYRLLKNTMFLSRHLDLEKHNLLCELRDSIKTEAEFIQQYFELLYIDKTGNEVMLCDLIHLGEYVHNQRVGKVNRHIERIPSPLKHIFEYVYISSQENKSESCLILASNQVKYLNYLHALYLRERFLSMHDDMDNTELIASASRLLNMPSTAEISESAYYAGQLLSELSEKEDILAALNSYEEKKQTRYENVLCLFLGCNHDIAEDIPGVFDFYHPVMRENYHDYLHVCDRIRVLRANSIKEVRFCYSGFAQLEKVDIENDVYFSNCNCLIKKSDNGLYIGCHNSVIPDGVLYIHSHAFSYCNIKSIILPSSVRELDRFAFKYCKMLEDVELGDGLNKLTREAFYKCSAIKTVCIKNQNMQIGHEAYDIRAFIGVPNLEKAVVPTTGISYIYKIAPHSLRYLDISQGKTCFSLVPLTFDDMDQTNKIEALIIRKDVEYIAEDAFIKFKNNLKTISVEPGGIAYRSVNNCLISNQENAIVLGCKNSIIPESGIKRIKSYAFARCDIQNAIITKDIESIGAKAFYKCYELTTIHISTGLNTIEEDAFACCFNLKNVIIEDVSKWAQIFFYTILSNPLFYSKALQSPECTNRTIKLKDGISLITSGAFKECTDIEIIFIPSSVKEIRGCAFLNCNDIKEVHIKDISSWVTIQFNSFSSNPLYQGARLFIDGYEAKELIFEENTTINKHSLIKTKSIESIVLKSGCCVDFEAFKDCPYLKHIFVEAINVKIDESAFDGCKATLYFSGTEEEWRSMYNHCKLKGIVSTSFNKSNHKI